MSPKPLLFLVAGALVMVGLFVLMKPDEPVSPAGPGAGASEVPPERTLYELIVEKGALVSGPSVIRVQQGDVIGIRVTSDVADEFHLHGYDERMQLRAGEPGTLELEADLSGRFGYELHGAHLELGALEVLPD